MFDVLPISDETWLVCGGRNFADAQMLGSALTDLARMRGLPKLLIHGAARGADTLADGWANRLAIPVVRFPANWEQFGRSAGAIRNQAMLDVGPDLVVAFPGGNGTADMMRRARTANVSVAEVQPSPTPQQDTITEERP